MSESCAIGWAIEDGGEDFISRGSLDPGVFPASWRADWRVRASSLRQLVRFDREGGWPCKSRALHDVSDEEFVRSLPPALQLAVNARTFFDTDAKWIPRGWNRKLAGVRVALDVQRKMWVDLCDLQARTVTFPCGSEAVGDVPHLQVSVPGSWI